MTDKYKPGDEVNGYILGSDGKWHPEAPPPIKPGRSPVVTIVAIVAGLIALLVIVGGAMAISDSNSDPVVRPTPTEPATVAPTTPTADPTTPEPFDPYEGQYEAVQALLKQAFRETGRTPADVCPAWTFQREKWTRTFANTAVDDLGANPAVAREAVQDFFDDICSGY